MGCYSCVGLFEVSAQGRPSPDIGKTFQAPWVVTTFSTGPELPFCSSGDPSSWSTTLHAVSSPNSGGPTRLGRFHEIWATLMFSVKASAQDISVKRRGRLLIGMILDADHIQADIVGETDQPQILLK